MLLKFPTKAAQPNLSHSPKKAILSVQQMDPRDPTPQPTHPEVGEPLASVTGSKSTRLTSQGWHCYASRKKEQAGQLGNLHLGQLPMPQLGSLRLGTSGMSSIDRAVAHNQLNIDLSNRSQGDLPQIISQQL